MYLNITLFPAPLDIVNLSLCQVSSTSDQRGVMAPFSNNSSSFETWLHAALEKILCFLRRRAIKAKFPILTFLVLTNAVFKLPVVQ